MEDDWCFFTILLSYEPPGGSCLWDSAASPCSYHAQLNASKPHSAIAVWLGQNWMHYDSLPAFLLSLGESWNLSQKEKKKQQNNSAEVLRKLASTGKKMQPYIHTDPLPNTRLITCFIVHPIHVLWTLKIVYFGSDFYHQWNCKQSYLCNTIIHQASLQFVSEDTSQCKSPITKSV